MTTTTHMEKEVHSSESEDVHVNTPGSIWEVVSLKRVSITAINDIVRDLMTTKGFKVRITKVKKKKLRFLQVKKYRKRFWEEDTA